MPIAAPEVYAQMIDRVGEDRFAYPVINVSSFRTLNAAPQDFAETDPDDIIQVSTGGTKYFLGLTIRGKVAGISAFAAFAQEVAKNCLINVIPHIDHCPKGRLDSLMHPLLAIPEECVRNGQLPLFQSHMRDGSVVSTEENLTITNELLSRCTRASTILEIEVNIIDGEKDGVFTEINKKLYTTVADGLRTVKMLGLGEKSRYMTTLTSGNVHGMYKPRAVKLRPEVLREIRGTIGTKHGRERPFDLIFHGESDSSPQRTSDTMDFGVVRIDTDTGTQYAFTRPVADHMLRNYNDMLRVGGKVGSKEQYDSYTWDKAAEVGIAKRVVKACKCSCSTGARA